MKSIELINIKLVSEHKKKKILLINPKRKGVEFSIPHNGLAILAAILKKRGHEVLVVDYTLIHETKDISFFLHNFRPDIIGLSSYSANQQEAGEIISRIHKIAPEKILFMGGPYATLYPKKLQEDKRIDYIFVGEAELTIIPLVEKSKKMKSPKIIQSEEMADLNHIPFPDFKSFYKWETIRNYPLITSRGCPFKCSFCSIHFFSNRRWRPRTPENCIEELENAKKSLSPNIRVVVCDDCPTADINRFIKFLKIYKDKIKLNLSIVNTRADCVNDELLSLLKECGCEDFWLGVEHAHPEVYKLVNKGESLEQIEKAAKMVKAHGMNLGLSFIIGLPGDNLQRTKASIAFAKRNKADFCNWSIVVPYEHTEVREWFDKNGVVNDLINYDSRINIDFSIETPRAESKDFSIQDRLKAQYMCVFETVSYPCTMRNFMPALKASLKYNLLPDFIYWLPRGLIKNLKLNKERILKIISFYKREGLMSSIQRVFYVLSRKK